MICGPIEFNPTDTASPPTITVASIRKITDPQELQELVELLAATPSVPDRLASH
jgi:hypothetical protein